MIRLILTDSICFDNLFLYTDGPYKFIFGVSIKNQNLMKKLIVLALIIVFGSATVVASNPEKTTPENLRSEIVKILNAPEFSFEEKEVSALIKFTLNSKGEIVVLSVDSDNEQVDFYVKNELNYKRIVNVNTQRGQIFTMPLRIMRSKA